MSEKKKRARILASLVAKQMEPLNSNEKFKKRFKNTNLKLLLNAIDRKYAALIKIENSTVEIEGISNKEKKI